MHGPLLATLLVAASLALAPPTPTGAPDAIAEARQRLARQDGIAAVAILEDALPDAGANKDAVLDLLRSAFEVAARQAQDAGRPRDAETYRENLKILSRKTRPAPAAATAPSPTPEAPEKAVEVAAMPPDPTTGPTPLPDIPPPPSSGVPPAPPFASAPESNPEPSPRPAIAEPKEAPPATSSTLLPMPAEAPAPDVASADASFAAKQYEEAGRIYGALARDRRLPAERRDHWAYCRSTEVVKRINARPQTEAEWASIVAEIDQIRALSPNFWPGEYLRSKAAERLAGKKKPKASKAVVVRGQTPEEPAAIDRPVRPASNEAPPETPRPAVAATANPANKASRNGSAVGRWQIRDTANFRIYHVDVALADQVAQVAESVRREQTKRWTNQYPRAPWQPQCEIYLYPTARQYAQMTGQPEDSPGFSTMGMNAGRIISRRVNLRANHPALIQAVLPHEVTHVILADYFTEQQIPRWADEGMAVLSEPADEQERRAADLINPLADNRLFPIEALMSMDYPDNRYWGLYYAQSVSLTRFLVEQGTPAQMVQFLQGSQRNGYEAELRRVYKIDGYPDLQRRWLASARNLSPSRTATANGPDLKIR